MSDYKAKMDSLVKKFVDDITELTRDIARETLMSALEKPLREHDDGQALRDAHAKRIKHAIKKAAKKTVKAAKKAAKKTVKKIEKQVKNDKKQSKRDANRAYVLRQKQRNGKKLEDGEVEWLTQYIVKHPSTRLAA